MPIYVGKAAPGGRRTGRTTIGNTLYGRLSEHRKSIEAVDNLKIEDFAFKVAPMEIDLVSGKEAVLSRHFSFVWNKEISGFGIHDQEFLDSTSPRIYPWNQSKIENRKSSSPRIYPWGQSKI
jgi:hypothetical protein